MTRALKFMTQAENVDFIFVLNWDQNIVTVVMAEQDYYCILILFCYPIVLRQRQLWQSKLVQIFN